MPVEPKWTKNLKVRDEPAVGGYVIESPDVGHGYFSGVGCATQRDPNPIHGGGISDETARANAALWAAAPEMREALGDDLAGRPFAVLLEEAANALSAAGGGPLEDCLRAKAAAVHAALAKAEGRA